MYQQKSTKNRRESTKIVQNRQRTNHNEYNKNRQKTTKIVQDLPQHFLKSAKPSKIDNNLTAN